MTSWKVLATLVSYPESQFAKPIWTTWKLVENCSTVSTVGSIVPTVVDVCLQLKNITPISSTPGAYCRNRSTNESNNSAPTVCCPVTEKLSTFPFPDFFRWAFLHDQQLIELKHLEYKWWTRRFKVISDRSFLKLSAVVKNV